MAFHKSLPVCKRRAILIFWALPRIGDFGRFLHGFALKVSAAFYRILSVLITVVFVWLGPRNTKQKAGTRTPWSCYNQLQKYLRHCTVFWHRWPVHDLVLVIPPPPLIKVASNTRPYSKLRGTTLNGREEGGQYYILQTCDQERFEARKVVFPWECLIIFATGCSNFDKA